MSKSFLYVDTSGAYFESPAYESIDFINSSTGAADAGKPVVLDAAGNIDASMINPFDIQGISEWKNSVLSAVILTPPASPVTGDRYLIKGTGTGVWAGKDGQIAEYGGAAWVYSGAPLAGWTLSADNEQDGVYLYSGSAWLKKVYESTTASTGVTKVGVDIQLASSAAGAGLGFTTGVLDVNVDNATIEIATDILQVKAGGINDTHIDFGIGANQVSAFDLPIADAGNKFTATEVEGALLELHNSIVGSGISYTVGTGGVAIGNPVYISANDTVLPYTNIAVDNRIVGIAFTTEASAASVVVAANDTVISGLTFTGSPSAGSPIYWDGTNLTATFPSGSGNFVWQVGFLKNATDLHVETRFIKKNA